MAGQIRLDKDFTESGYSFWYIRVTEPDSGKTIKAGYTYKKGIGRPLPDQDRDWATDRVREIRTCCDTKEWRPCDWCGWWERDQRGRDTCIAGRIGRPLCRWCYDWHHSDYTDNRPYRPHLVERTAHTLEVRRLLPRPAGGTQMPFSVKWNIAEYLVSMWDP